MPILELSRKESRLGRRTFKVGMIPTMVSGQSYYRMAGFCWKMRRQAHVEAVCSPFAFDQTVENPWERDYLTDPKMIHDHIDNICEKSDVVVWQTIHYQYSLDLFEQMRLRHQKPFLVETDDYVFDIPPNNIAFDSWRPGSQIRKAVSSQIRQADCVIVSTPYLAGMYKADNENIRVVPNSIDFEEWKGIGQRKHDRIRIGWIGGATHSDDLEMVAPALQRILNKYPNVWLYCIHGVPQVFKKWKEAGMNVYWTHKWAQINLYPKFMASFKFDIGIAPLVDNNFNRGKSNLRWLEYSALSIPTVASPLPDFTRAITPGHDGIIAKDLDEWEEALETLIENENKRVQMGRNANKTIRTNFNMSKTARNYLHILREVASW